MSRLILSLLCTLSSILINLRLGFPISQPIFVGNSCKELYYYNRSKIPFGANLNLLLSYLSSKASLSANNGFYNSTIGHNHSQDQVYGSFLCRGDVTQQTCQNCVKIAAKEIKQRCPVHLKAFVWYEECMLQYSASLSTNNGFTSVDYLKPVCILESRNLSEPNKFYKTLSNLMESLATQAANSGSSSRILYFATGEANFKRFHKIYGLLQCTRDLCPSACNTCLRAAIAQIHINNKSGEGIYYRSCVVRYSDSPFYKHLSTASAPPVIEKETSIGAVRNSFQTSFTIFIVVVITVMLFLIIFFSTQRRMQKSKKCDEVLDEIMHEATSQFDFRTIKAATDNFSDVNMLGVGGFGAVYKGRFSNGQEVAVKRLSSNSKQGEEEFMNEVALLTKLQHRNLVKLLGFCLEGKQLIYEFVPNKSLDYFLFDPIKRADLDWEKRYKIIEGIAQGILYLHEDSPFKIIHRDLKPSNILLDAKMNPKISDFGLARLVVMGQTRENTNKIVGTCGYMPPEYAIKGQFSVKSDVYSFGVILLEILSGENVYSFYHKEDAQTLLGYAWTLWHEGKGLEFVDTLLRDSCPSTEVLRCLIIGLLCVQGDVQCRPTMSAVILMLKETLNTLPLPRQPAVSMRGTSVQEYSVNEVTFSSFSPR